jgi:hypothetical protein
MRVSVSQLPIPLSDRRARGYLPKSRIAFDSLHDLRETSAKAAARLRSGGADGRRDLANLEAFNMVKNEGESVQGPQLIENPMKLQRGLGQSVRAGVRLGSPVGQRARRRQEPTEPPSPQPDTRDTSGDLDDKLPQI